MIADGSLILADLTKQAPNGSYCPPTEYRDAEFACLDCGKPECWTARQQQWWYEVAKGSIYSGASRCRECRRIDRLIRKAAQWPLSQKPLAVVLDIDDSRVRRMKHVVGKLDPKLVPVSRLTTNKWDHGIWHVLPGTRFLSLTGEWLSAHEKSFAHRGGFLRSFLRQRPRCPLLFAGNESEESRNAVDSFRKAGWRVVEIGRGKSDWIESDWRDAVSSLLKLKTAGQSRPCGSINQ